MMGGMGTTLDILEARLDDIARAPQDLGRVDLIVRRPAVGEREIVETASVDPALGLVGDIWATKPTVSTLDGAPNPGKQVTLMSAAVARAIAGDDHERWALAGDQLYVELDLRAENLPAGTRLGIGSAVLEVSGEPHLGCKKFAARFGPDALRFVNGAERRGLNLRGVNTRVVAAGSFRTGDPVEVLRA
jgi:hypothetical protein